MNRSFLDDRNFPLFFTGIIIGIPLLATLAVSCTKPSPDEKAEVDSGYAANLKEETVTFSPRPGVECYVIRGYSNTNPRVMSCVVLPSTTTTGQ